MVVLGTRAVAFINPDKRGAWEAHGVDVYVVGRCPLHYRLIEFFNEKTRAYMKAGTYTLYPKHSRTPTISEADRTLIAAGDMLQRLQQAVSTTTEQKLQHNKVIDKLTDILGPQRVADRAAPRVGEQATATADPTARDKVRAARPVHQRTTRANPNPIQLGPLPTIWEDGGMTAPTNKPTSGEH